MVFPVTAKLTGSIMIPSADVNPTRPMPPGSSRSKHLAGLSVRRARSCAPGAGRGLPAGQGPERIPPVRRFPSRLSYIFTSAIRRLFRFFSLVLRHQRRCGPRSAWPGRSALRDIRATLAGVAGTDAPVLGNGQAQRLIPGR
jgi:hypothetical protein